jgi:predicted acyltransferase
VIAGLWLASTRSYSSARRGLAAAGAVAFIAGELWGLAFPINKQLWTSSYVLLTAGAAALLLALCMSVANRDSPWTRPFTVLGNNALALFVVSGLLGKAIIYARVGGLPVQAYVYQHGFGWLTNPKNGSLLYSIVFLALMYGMCDLLYRRRIFVRA